MKYYLFSGATGGALQGGLQMIGIDFSPIDDFDGNNPLRNVELNLGIEWILFFLIISLAGAIVGSISSIFVNGNITKNNVIRVCAVSAAFGLFFPVSLNLIKGYVESQNFIGEQKEANKELSEQVSELNEKIIFNPNLQPTVQETEKIINSYKSLITKTSSPEISIDAIKKLEQIGLQNKDNQLSNKVLDSLNAVETQKLLINKDLIIKDLNRSIDNIDKFK